jgi:uncharacterized small protein (DUF1192 family)
VSDLGEDDLYGQIWEKIALLEAENNRLKAELKFSEHRMISLAEALADTRLGFQKEIEVLKKGHTNPKRDKGTKKADNKGKPSRPGVDGKIVRHKPSKGGGTY